MHENTLVVAGMDEAGRGSWAGPVVAAAVILPENYNLPGLNDSKLLVESKREELYELIMKSCDYGVGIIDHSIIDSKGLLHATFLAFDQAFNKLRERPQKILIDGRDKFKFAVSHESIIGGDRLIPAISAASILAKVTRDRLMLEYSKKFKVYNFEENKGYGTEKHQTALEEFGPCEIHRKSYKPIIKLKWKQNAFL